MTSKELASIEAEMGVLMDYIDALPPGTQATYVTSQAALVMDLIESSASKRIQQIMARRSKMRRNDK